MNLLPLPANAAQADATVAVLEFLADAQVVLRQTPIYLEQVRAGQSSRRLARYFCHSTAPKTIRRARDFARVPELASLRDHLLKVATELDRLRAEARKLL